MNNDPTFLSPAADGHSTLPSPGLYRYIARTMRVSVRHLSWEIAQQLHTEHEAPQNEDVSPSIKGSLRMAELDDYCWRADVTEDNIAAAQALGWGELHRLLCLAQTCQCEALELAGDNPALPAALDFVVFPWP